MIYAIIFILSAIINLLLFYILKMKQDFQYESQKHYQNFREKMLDTEISNLKQQVLLNSNKIEGPSSNSGWFYVYITENPLFVSSIICSTIVGSYGLVKIYSYYCSFSSSSWLLPWPSVKSFFGIKSYPSWSLWFSPKVVPNSEVYVSGMPKLWFNQTDIEKIYKNNEWDFSKTVGDNIKKDIVKNNVSLPEIESTDASNGGFNSNIQNKVSGELETGSIQNTVSLSKVESIGASEEISSTIKNNFSSELEANSIQNTSSLSEDTLISSSSQELLQNSLIDNMQNSARRGHEVQIDFPTSKTEIVLNLLESSDSVTQVLDVIN